MRAVFFDVDGVLLHSFFHPDPAKRRRWDDHLLEDVGIAPDQLNLFFETRFNSAMLGQTSIISELDAYLPTIGYNGSSMDFLSYWLMRDTHINLPLLNLIRRLRSRSDAALYIATNQEHIRAFHLWNEVGFRHYFDDMFHAARLGVSKSDRAYYEKVEDIVGLDAEAPLIFDDSERVVAAASKAGWEAVLYHDLRDFTDHPWIVERLGVSTSSPAAESEAGAEGGEDVVDYL